jgi:hypothetical protein
MSQNELAEPVAFFVAGPPKCATTWLFHCLREHPEIYSAHTDELMYFDMFYALGDEWYRNCFPSLESGEGSGRVRIDTTSSYIWSARTAERIHAYNNAAKTMVVLRNPVDRAFSHYWHLKHRGLVNYEFSDIITNYQTFSCWLEPGFVNAGIKRFLNFFPMEQMHFALFDDLQKKPAESLKKMYQFIGIDDVFQAPSAAARVNVAGPRITLKNRFFSKSLRMLFGEERMNIRPGDDSRFARISGMLTGKTEYQQGVDPELRRKLMVLCAPEIREMEELTGIDLSHWT